MLCFGISPNFIIFGTLKKIHMKKLYFIALSLFAGLTISNAQVLDQTNHAPSVGDMYEVFQVDSSIVNPGASGTGAVWTFTTAEYTRTNVPLTYSCSASSNTMYPGGAVARSSGASANYYTSTSTALNFWGGNFQALSFSVDYYFSSPAIHAAYSMAYNTTTNSAFTGSLQTGSNSGSISGGTSTVTVDGSGTLNLPTRSFSNVLRVNTYTGFNFNIPAFFANGSVKQQTWDYYSMLTEYPSTKTQPLFSILVTTISVTSPTNVTQTSTLVLINKDYQYVGITENSKEVAELNLFPNPANENFNLIFVNENATNVNVEITNAIGQTVKKENLPSSKGVVNHSFNVSDLKAGIYFVKVNVGDKSSIRKLTIQ